MTLTTIQKATTTMKNLKNRIAFWLLALLLPALPAQAQTPLDLERDTLPFFRGFAVSGELVGAMQMMLGDYGQYEAALRLNLRNRYFPIFEVGYGKANHEQDAVTEISYKTQAPYFRIGIDKNLLKKKHGPNRLYGGLRYAFTSYKVDMERPDFPDPVWLWDTGFGAKDVPCKQHWLEVVIGVDAKIFGPMHLGWCVRYKRRIYHDEGSLSNTWYVPGFGTNDSSKFDAGFNVIIDI